MESATFEQHLDSRQWTSRSPLSFDNFFTAPSNQLAFDAARHAANCDGHSLNNPLVIYGAVGLGKTHLLHAISNQFAKAKPLAKICCLHTERFVSDVVSTYQRNKFEKFRSWHHSLDILLLDDIQFVAGKVKTCEELFYIINSLIENNKQVVFSCDSLPSEITGIEPKLMSRLSGGNIVSIESPEFEMRMGILIPALLAECDDGVEVARFIAGMDWIPSVRELIGVEKRVMAYAKFHKLPITLELAKQALSDVINAPPGRSQNDKRPA